MSNPVEGPRWTPFSFTIAKDAQKAFDEAVAQLVGVGYTAVACATDEAFMGGIHYCFICKAVVIVPSKPESAKLVYIIKPLPMPVEGKAHISQIKQIVP